MSSPAAPTVPTSATTTPEGRLTSTPGSAATQAAFAGIRRVPQPENDPNKSYLPGSPERAELKARLKAMAAEKIDIPVIIGGREIRTGRTEKSVMPHNHAHVLGEYHLADAQQVEQAIAAAAVARRLWANWPW